MQLDGPGVVVVDSMEGKVKLAALSFSAPRLTACLFSKTLSLSRRNKLNDIYMKREKKEGKELLLFYCCRRQSADRRASFLLGMGKNSKLAQPC